ncbi:MAG TPA: SCO family protein [Sphingomicrobium sp.]|nr:SCO family protein [Sphingomicrobium sp.]
MKRVRILLWALAALALVAFGALLLRQPSLPQQSGPAPASLGGAFVLTGVDGEEFSSKELDGKPYAIFFGFTHCPDVCPATLARLIRLRRQLEAGPDKLNIVFVTVDPERDGAAELKRYLGLFHEPLIGLTGTPAQIDQVKRQFGIFSQKVQDESGGYTVDHTATVLLFDRQGLFDATIAPDEGDEAALAKLRRLVDESAGSRTSTD